jgi:hypothetical protein
MSGATASDRQTRCYEYLENFDMDKQAKGPFPLSQWEQAVQAPGVYEIGLGAGSGFRPRYLGKAVRQMLRVRLGQHYRKSSNEEIRKRLAANQTLYFRYLDVKLGTETLAVINVIEGVCLIGFDDKYVWNGRQEWNQHFAVEDL